jgi:spermidine synthase
MASLLPYVLFFFSGFTGLALEVLWARQLGLLFGGTVQAAAVVLSVYFGGLGAGAWFWGSGSVSRRSPLSDYAFLELGVALSAACSFALLPIYLRLYPSLYPWFESFPGLQVFVKAALAATLLFPATFFMGGTLPVLSRNPLSLGGEPKGPSVSLLYALNTLGAASGAFLTGFYLPIWFGVRASGLGTIAVIVLVAMAALLAGRRSVPTTSDSALLPDPEGSPTSISEVPRGLKTLAFFSGFLIMTLEVLWTRMFAQVLWNTVYSFAIILVIFLLFLGLAAAFSTWMGGKRSHWNRWLIHTLAASSLLVASSPFLWYRWTDGFSYVTPRVDWSLYLVSVFVIASGAIAPAVFVAGTVFPCLLESLKGSSNRTRWVGLLLTLNTSGAVLGSILTGFLLIPQLGLWESVRLAAAMYLLLAFGLALKDETRRPGTLGALIAAGALLFTFLNPARLPLVKPAEEERVLKVWEGSSGTLAVVERKGNFRMKVNNSYTLGGSATRKNEQRQGHLPLLIHPDPKRVFFLGLGTGITAGAALDHPVEEVTVAELLPEAIEGARTYFQPFLNGLFEDRRARVIHEDGRHFLTGTNRKFDVVIADLFLPFKKGTGYLYTVEHYRQALSALTPEGIYCQWLPLYQLCREDFDLIARTMVSVFPRVTVWRGEFYVDEPIMALVGHASRTALDPSGARDRLSVLRLEGKPADRPGVDPFPASLDRFLLYYAGNLTEALGTAFPSPSSHFPASSATTEFEAGADPGAVSGSMLISPGPVHSDNFPWIEYHTPIVEQRVRLGVENWFKGRELIDFYTDLHRILPPHEDPYLKNLTPEERKKVDAGLMYHRLRWALDRKDSEAAERYEAMYLELMGE